MRVSIQGDGVAAACCAHLLSSHAQIAWNRTERARVPVILLTGAALTLMGDIFGPLHPLAASHRIRRRVVAWGPNAEPVEAAHPAVVVSEQFLLDAISQNLNAKKIDSAGEWSIFTAHPLPRGSAEHSFGIRRATAYRVELRKDDDGDACWIESTSAGWLFLIPTSTRHAYLLVVGVSGEQCLAESRLLSGRIGPVGAPVGTFATQPRMQWPLCGPSWLACGSAAMAFDPLCGDGTAQAVREAILAVAVLRAIQDGANSEALKDHYQARLVAGMARHLTLCAEFYRTAGQSDWWATACRSIQDGTQWCAGKLEGNAGLRYQMNGFELRPVA